MECSDCLSGVRPVSIALAALGSAAILALTAESDVVIAIAEAAEVSADGVVQMLPAIAAVLASGIDAISQTICAAAGAC